MIDWSGTETWLRISGPPDARAFIGLSYRITDPESHTRVRVSVNGKDELALVEAKGTPVAGGIGLWVGMGTEGYFSNLRVTPR